MQPPKPYLLTLALATTRHKQLSPWRFHTMMVDSVCYGTKLRKMPLTRDKPLENNYTNNNDHSYLHKKFKKMASSIAVFPATSSKVGEIRHEVTAAPASCNSVFSNGTVAATHLELQKIRDQTKYYIRSEEKNLQINISEGNNRISDKYNIDQISGQISSTDVFSNKTENLVNEFIRDSHNGATGGRYICPYCKLSCAKPSVLQKHIRAHTNERPYPCIPCGIAFKTKSNLYKHYRSRTHAARLQGADVIPQPVDEEELSGGSESDSSLSSYCNVDTVFDTLNIRNENIESAKRSEYSSPETTNDRITPPIYTPIHADDSRKSKTIYKPKFRAALYEGNEEKDKIKKNISPNANFLTEHISKIISDNKAIVDVIETPLQKKYGKIKQIAESKQLVISDSTPLNLTKNNSDTENSFRKRSHSESFPQNDHNKHPLNPEGSIIKDLLLKNKLNGLTSYSGDNIEGPVFICPLCQYIYQSADNLEIHRMYYCKGNLNNNFVRSNSLNDKFTNCVKLSPPLTPPLRSKPDNLVIVKSESMDVIAPLPSPGPLLGNTRLVDTRSPSEFNKTCESLKLKPTGQSSRRKHDCTVPDSYNNLRIAENLSPRASDPYQQPKIRCIEATTTGLRSIEEISQHMRQNSTSLQMFGGEVKIVDHSGGTTTLRIEPSKNQLSPILTQPILSPSKLVTDAEASNVVVRSGLHSGGTMVHNPPTPKEIISTPQTPRISISNAKGCSSSKIVHEKTLFQFPPFNAITAFNPLTLPLLSPSSPPNVPTKILHAGKLIPHVPGIPGPNTPGDYVGNRSVQKNSYNEILRNSVGQKTETTSTTQSSKTPHFSSKIDTVGNNRTHYSKVLHVDSEKENANLLKLETVQCFPAVPIIKVKSIDESNGFIKSLTSNQVKLTSTRQETLKRNAEGVPKLQNLTINHASAKAKISDKPNSNSVGKNVEPKSDTEIRHFNFENFITKAEIYNIQIQSSTEVQKNTDAHDMPLTSVSNERSETSYFQKSNTAKASVDERKPKFLRPSTLPLKPGTFIPKKHHGITPNANTMPLVSPETPRPAKAYGQLYLNGNAYTYLGLKCSTKVFYCTINRPQPTYVPNQHFLSMYSNWQLFSELTPDPLGLSASSAMSLYDSRHRPQNVVVAPIKQDLMLTHSSQWDKNSKDYDQSSSMNNKRIDENKFPLSESCSTTKKELAGGFESNEEYTYVRGRGRGRYVCLECGIRCNKPSMLKKHVRTHTDVRPYTCIHCAFSFKTKGNLTKHTKSKAHYKKCCELGINPNEGNDNDGGEMTQGGETDEDTESDGDEGNEGETESSDTEVGKSQLPEHEAAHCLLSLGNSRQLTSATPGLITSARPSTYPYAPQGAEKPTPELSPERSHENRSSSVESKSDLNCEPIDLSKSDVKISPNIAEIPTARESSVLASLASNTAKLPQHHSQWSNGEPLLHTYLTERALYDSKIKQSQLTSSISKPKKVELEKSSYVENTKYSASVIKNEDTKNDVIITCVTSPDTGKNEGIIKLSPTKDQNFIIDESSTNTDNINKSARMTSTNAENAKHVVSEYLKHARINQQMQPDNANEHNITQICTEDTSQTDDVDSESDAIKLPCVDHDPVARKVVIGAGGVAFKVSKSKGFEGTSYSQGRLMEDGRRVCDFCNKTFSKPSQLRLHLNIHYMERPFRCSACAVSFRTRGHLQKHERSGSHHNKVSMTSTFGAATSLNPRPFRCSDCNIAFRIHGHLAKHLRSKMHVMRLECLFKLPFGTFTEIERAGVSLTDIDTTDCASSLASLQSLARTLHEKDPTKLEYREPNSSVVVAAVNRESSEDEDVSIEKNCESDRDCDKTENSENQDTES